MTSEVAEVVDPAAAKLEVVDLPVLVELQRMGKAHQEGLEMPLKTFLLQNLLLSYCIAFALDQRREHH